MPCSTVVVFFSIVGWTSENKGTMDWNPHEFKSKIALLQASRWGFISDI